VEPGKRRRQKRTSPKPASRRKERRRPRPRPASVRRPDPGAEEGRRPAPRQAAERAPARSHRPGAVVAPVPEPSPGRGVVEVRHPLAEGLVELLVDGRRAGLVRVGPGTAFPPGTPVTVAFSVSPGEHRLLLRVLSATARIELEQEWTEFWPSDGFRARRWQVTGGQGRWALSAAP